MRNRELDALRGLAAISVLLYHVLALNWPPLQNGVYLEPADRTIHNILIFTPLHVTWLGIEAVWFFFVLSGFVLTKAATREGFAWQAYYPSRIVRIYGPVLCAIVFAWLTYVLIPHVVEPGDNPAIGTLPTGYPFADILRDATLLGGTSTSIGVLWSLQWEIVFSLALPLYIFAVRRLPKLATVIAVSACVLGWLVNDQVTMYMPMFFFGALLAQYWGPICTAFRFLGSGGWMAHTAGVALTVVSVSGMTSFFLLGRQLSALGLPPRAATLPLVLGGIVLLTITSVNWPPLSRLLSTKAMVFLGTISFSLYLVHRPIIIALAFLFGIGTVPAILGIVVSVAIAIGFYFLLERPIHRISQKLNRSLQQSVPA